MQKPTRNSRTCTTGILTWPENQPPVTAVTGHHRSHQPSDDIGDVLRGKKVSENEAHNLAKWKPSSGYRRTKEATGNGKLSSNAEDTTTSEAKSNAANSKDSGIFSANAENTTSEANAANSKDRTGIRVYQQAMNGISQISFNTEEDISPNKKISLPEAAKQCELGGTLQNEPGTNSKKLMSSSKTKEIGGNNIFGPPDEIVPRTLAAAGTLDSKVSNREYVVVHRDGIGPDRDRLLGGRRHAGGGSNIFADGKAENRDRLLGARRHADGGSNIFADGKAENRDRLLGGRRPPGGASSIVLD